MFFTNADLRDLFDTVTVSGFDNVIDYQNKGTTNYSRDVRNTYEKDDVLTFELLVPGVDKKNLDITVEKDNVLAVKVAEPKTEKSKETEEATNEFKWHNSEYTVIIPTRFVEDYKFNESTGVTLKNGILTVSVPKSAVEKTKLILK